MARYLSFCSASPTSSPNSVTDDSLAGAGTLRNLCSRPPKPMISGVYNAVLSFDHSSLLFRQMPNSSTIQEELGFVGALFKFFSRETRWVNGILQALLLITAIGYLYISW
ncbi:hypothetical protein J6590_016082 [Homalodisca vitripennis]|nr:hypothetical protein J6590_016082 [Homalodisca vitripennis]